MKFIKFSTVQCVLLFLAMVTPTLPAGAQTFPNKPIRLMVGFPPGGGTDITARLLAAKLGDHLGQPVVVENRPGAAGTIAAKQIAKSEPDGYRILMTASGTFIHSVLSSGPAYNIESELTPISMVSVSPLVVMVGSSVPVRDIGELIELARSKSGQMTFGSDGIGSTGHLAGELFNSMAKVKMLHVPYKGSGDVVVALASGQVDVIFPSMAAATPLLKSGKFRALAVTSIKRSTLLPSIPSLDESGLSGFDLVAWFALVGPVGMPQAVVEKLNAAIIKVVGESDVKDTVGKQGMELQAGSPEMFSKYLRESGASISRLGKQANIKLE